MKKKGDAQLQSILDVTERMIVISDEGFAACNDDGCLLVNGLVRECAYRLRDAAELELDVHSTNAKGGAA